MSLLKFCLAGIRFHGLAVVRLSLELGVCWLNRPGRELTVRLKTRIGLVDDIAATTLEFFMRIVPLGFTLDFELCRMD